ncbi:hypothetical protein LCGC14_0761450 [marine sediment metagenome]|uniref:ATP-dependent Clp protease proteolytic subunit n=1 Tax=marine sediment metagenome TaxID=412755 RepID=A0A0F9Q141_9ZZZZ
MSQNIPAKAVPALIKKLNADARKANAEAYAFELEGAVGDLQLAGAIRIEKERLASNKFHHVFNYIGGIDQNSVAICMDQLTLWDRLDPGCGIEIVFNSPGGSVMAGMALFDHIQAIRKAGHQVTTVSNGYAASMAGILLQAGDIRVIGKESYVLIHQISSGAVGKIGEIEDVVKFLKLVSKRVLGIFADRSNKPASYFEKHWERTDWWLDSEECMKIGFVDEVR